MGIGEAASHRGASRLRLFRTTACAAAMRGAALTWWADGLVWPNIAAQVANATLLPVLAGTVTVLAAAAPPASDRLHGWRS